MPSAWGKNGHRFGIPSATGNFQHRYHVSDSATSNIPGAGLQDSSCWIQRQDNKILFGTQERLIYEEFKSFTTLLDLYVSLMVDQALRLLEAFFLLIFKTIILFILKIPICFPVGGSTSQASRRFFFN